MTTITCFVADTHFFKKARLRTSICDPNSLAVNLIKTLEKLGDKS